MSSPAFLNTKLNSREDMIYDIANMRKNRTPNTDMNASKAAAVASALGVYSMFLPLQYV